MTESGARTTTIQPLGEDLLDAPAPSARRSATLLPIASVWHTVLVLAVISVSAYRGWPSVGQIRMLPHRITIYQRTMLFEWLTLALALAGVWLKGSSLYSVLGGRWRSAGQF
ncbi:MAG: hypothetical protein DMG80_01210 [Acidobacteria bacterium]|nr:MAG: hypothetical protein DMG80_01210 [Acidobacteriota bacterium]